MTLLVPLRGNLFFSLLENESVEVTVGENDGADMLI